MKDQSSKRPLSVSKSENVLQGWYTAEMSNVSREDGEETDFSVTITNEAMAPSHQRLRFKRLNSSFMCPHPPGGGGDRVCFRRLDIDLYSSTLPGYAAHCVVLFL